MWLKEKRTQCQTGQREEANTKELQIFMVGKASVSFARDTSAGTRDVETLPPEQAVTSREKRRLRTCRQPTSALLSQPGDFDCSQHQSSISVTINSGYLKVFQLLQSL